jgi:hypothetical protein
MIVRISKGRFDLERVDEVERLLAASEEALRAPLRELPGLLHYYVGIDRDAGTVTNTSVWDTIEHARVMNELRPMLAQRPLLEGAGVVLEQVTNHEVLRSLDP